MHSFTCEGNLILRSNKTSIECIDVWNRLDLVYVNHCNILFASRKVIMMVVEESADVMCIIHNYHQEWVGGLQLV